jgi:kynureninase
MSFAATLDHARARDAADPLRSFRERFAVPTGRDGAPLAYLCGHSLGLAPKAARSRVLEELEDWERLAVAGHESARRPWIDYHAGLAAGLAGLAGALPLEVIAMNSLTVNLHLMMASFYRPTRTRFRVLLEAGAFPSDRHAVTSQIAWHGLDAATALIELAPRPGEHAIREEDLDAAIARHGAELALVLWPGVQFRTGQLFDIARIARAARRVGARAGFDLAHAIGNVPLAMHDSEADFAVWCHYKYLNAGPGAIGGAFVHERHARAVTIPRLSGWWGHDAQTRFAMRPDFVPEPGAPGWAVSNPPILSAAPLLASLEIFQQAGLARLREKSRALTAWLEFLVRSRLGVDAVILTPAAPECRGCQLSIRVAATPERSRHAFERLGARGVVGDFREPDVIRLAPAPLYNSFEDVWRAAAALAESTTGRAP